MKTDYIFESLANEYCDEYCKTHGGNFTRESIRKAFLDGAMKRNAPSGYHEFVAWQQGRKNR